MSKEQEEEGQLAYIPVGFKQTEAYEGYGKQEGNHGNPPLPSPYRLHYREHKQTNGIHQEEHSGQKPMGKDHLQKGIMGMGCIISQCHPYPILCTWMPQEISFPQVGSVDSPPDQIWVIPILLVQQYRHIIALSAAPFPLRLFRYFRDCYLLCCISPDTGEQSLYCFSGSPHSLFSGRINQILEPSKNQLNKGFPGHISGVVNLCGFTYFILQLLLNGHGERAIEMGRHIPAYGEDHRQHDCAGEPHCRQPQGDVQNRMFSALLGILIDAEKHDLIKHHAENRGSSNSKHPVADENPAAHRSQDSPAQSLPFLLHLIPFTEDRRMDHEVEQGIHIAVTIHPYIPALIIGPIKSGKPLDNEKADDNAV